MKSQTLVRSLLPWSLPLLASLVCLLWVYAAYLRTPPTDAIFIDWTTYAFGTERVLRGESLYLPLQLTGPYSLPAVTPQGYIYPPSSAVLFTPFTLGPFFGLAAWLGFNLLLFVSGLAAVLNRELGRIGPVSLTYVLLGLNTVIVLPGGVMVPFTNAVLTANVNIGLAGLLAWCWATGSRRGWIPYVAAIAASFKVFPGVLALWAARRRGSRPLFVAAAVAGGISLATLPLVGPDEWASFLRALANAQPTCEGGRTSVACLAEPFVGPSMAKLAGLAVGMGLLAAAAIVRSEFAAFVLLTLGMLAPMADGHQHYLLFIYVLVVIAACRVLRGRRLRIPRRLKRAAGPSAAARSSPAG